MCDYSLRSDSHSSGNEKNSHPCNPIITVSSGTYLKYIAIQYMQYMDEEMTWRCHGVSCIFRLHFSWGLQLSAIENGCCRLLNLSITIKKASYISASWFSAPTELFSIFQPPLSCIPCYQLSPRSGVPVILGKPKWSFQSLPQVSDRRGKNESPAELNDSDQ